MPGMPPEEFRRFHDTKPWFRRGVEVGRKILKRWGNKPGVLEKFLEASQYHQGWLKLVDPPKVFPPTLTGPTTDEGLGGLGEEGFAMVEAVISHHLGRDVDEDALHEIRQIDKDYPVNASSELRKSAKHDPSRNEYQKKYQKKRYHGRKKQAIDMLGGKCSVCGTTRGLELDHKNPDTKSFNVTKLWSVPEAEFKREVRKCKLLCKKHHRERTSKQRENGDVKSIPGKTQYDSKGRKTKTRKKKTAEAQGMRISKKEALRLGKKVGVDWSKVDLDQFAEGIYVEQEHTDDLLTAAKISLDHLSERGDYYSLLKKVEGSLRSSDSYFSLAQRVAGVIHDHEEGN